MDSTRLLTKTDTFQSPAYTGATLDLVQGNRFKSVWRVVVPQGIPPLTEEKVRPKRENLRKRGYA